MPLPDLAKELGILHARSTIERVRHKYSQTLLYRTLIYTLPGLKRTPLYRIPGYTGCSGPTTKFSLAIPDSHQIPDRTEIFLGAGNTPCLVNNRACYA